MSKPLGPYSPVVRAGDFIYLSGQGGIGEDGVVEGGVAPQTEQTMKNIEALLATVGASMSDVVKATCYLTDMENYAKFNEIYAAAFGGHRPARTCIAAHQLPAGLSVEVDIIAYLPVGD